MQKQEWKLSVDKEYPKMRAAPLWRKMDLQIMSCRETVHRTQLGAQNAVQLTIFSTTLRRMRLKVGKMSLPLHQRVIKTQKTWMPGRLVQTIPGRMVSTLFLVRKENFTTLFVLNFTPQQQPQHQHQHQYQQQHQ